MVIIVTFKTDSTNNGRQHRRLSRVCRDDQQAAYHKRFSPHLIHQSIRQRKRSTVLWEKVQAGRAERQNAEQAPTGTGKLGDITVIFEADLPHVSKLREESLGAGSTSSKLYEIGDAPGKGVGLVTKQNIARGSRIISEPTLMSISPDWSLRKVVDAFKRLSLQTKFTALHSCTSEPVKPMHVADLVSRCRSEADIEAVEYPDPLHLKATTRLVHGHIYWKRVHLVTIPAVKAV